MVEVVEIEADFVGEDYLVIVFLRIRLLGEKVFFIAVFQGGRPRDAGTQLEDLTVLPFQLVGIARHVGTRSDETHVTDQYVPEFR